MKTLVTFTQQRWLFLLEMMGESIYYFSHAREEKVEKWSCVFTCVVHAISKEKDEKLCIFTYVLCAIREEKVENGGVHSSVSVTNREELQVEKLWNLV